MYRFLPYQYHFSIAALTSFFVLNGVTFGVTFGWQLLSERHTVHIAQVEKTQELTKNFYALIIAGKFSISSLQSSVKSLTYNQDFAENLIKIAGNQAYQEMLASSKKSVARDIQKINQAQKNLKEFIVANEDFMMTLNPEVRQQVLPILTINIPSQIKVWQAEQHRQNQMWKCSAVKSAPVCY